LKKTILITGGGGFIGSHLAAKCLSEGYHVTVVDNFSTGNISNIPRDAEIIKGDISEPDTLEKFPKDGFDVVLHVAAQSSGEVSQEYPEIDLEVNTLGTLRLLKWCKAKNVRHFLYASSMAVYGEPESFPINEDSACRPLSFYGISKRSSEHYIQHFFNDGLNTTVFRMFSVYGPGQNMTNLKQGMVSIFLAYLANNEEIHVKGSRDRFRDYTYIDDIVSGWMCAIDNPIAFGKVYNLATGIKTYVHELVDMEIHLYGKDPNTYPVKYSGSTPHDQFGLYADVTRIMKDLNWKPQYSLEDGLKKMITWIKNNSTGKTDC